MKKLAIANRGEVAVRIFRACRDLGIPTVLLHSEADTKTLAHRLCDQTHSLGPGVASESYLNIKANIQGALAYGADAIHPGFGFLSENANFAKACREHNLIFIGPSPESIELFGDKVLAREMAEKEGLPVIPGNSTAKTTKEFASAAEDIGYPVMIKASGGGGGRGLRLAHNEKQLREFLPRALQEAKSTFDSEKMFLEKAFTQAKHIEVQIFGTPGACIILGARDCSVQRRHQKIIEETATVVNPELFQAAEKLVLAAEYQGAGTVEFLVQEGKFYFLEMNTRLQVEHPVTEMTFGVDLVQAQILLARGVFEGFSKLQSQGHALECRICAENPFLGGQPSVGVLEAVKWPKFPGVRVDAGFETQDEVPPFYDSMIAKIIVHGSSRKEALEKMRQALSETIIFGLHSNIAYLQKILDHPDFVSGIYTTEFLKNNIGESLEKEPWSHFEKAILYGAKSTVAQVSSKNPKDNSPWFHWGSK